MKRFNTTLVALAFSSNLALAGTMGPTCVEQGITMPCENPAWSFAGKALYLQPNYGGNSYFLGTLDSTGGLGYYKNTPRWAWGFEIEAAHHFDTGNDINVNWYHYGNTTRRLLPIISQVGAPPSSYINVAIKPRWDAVNGEFAQRINFGDHKNVRFHGGGQYAQVISSFSDTQTGHNTEYISNKFTGFGPRFGADLTYGWKQTGFAIYANGAAAALVGSSQFVAATAGVVDNAGRSSAASPIIVPEIEGKLGANYTLPTGKGNIVFDAGYMWVNYINVFSLLTVEQHAKGVTDFGLNGIYFGLKWLGSL